MFIMNSTMNLKSPVDIRYAIERKGGGRGAMKSLAKELSILPSALSMNVNGDRAQKYILEGIANYLGQPVYGVPPSGGK